MIEPWVKYIEPFNKSVIQIKWSRSKPRGWYLKTKSGQTETHLLSFCRLESGDLFAYRFTLGPLCITFG